MACAAEVADQPCELELLSSWQGTHPIPGRRRGQLSRRHAMWLAGVTPELARTVLE